MCNRAVVLNHVIHQATEEDVSVKPINDVYMRNWEHLAERKKGKTKKKKKEKEKKEFMGLSSQFYHVSASGDESLEDETDLSMMTAAEGKILLGQLVCKSKLFSLPFYEKCDVFRHAVHLIEYYVEQFPVLVFS